MEKCTLLEEAQIWGYDTQLESLRKYGLETSITDLAILTGGFVSCFHTNEDSSLAGRTGWIWTSSTDIFDDNCIVTQIGDEDTAYPYFRNGCIRPVLPLSVLEDIHRIPGYNGVEEVEYGEYPQMAVAANMQKILERKYVNEEMHKTDKTYTFDSSKWNNHDEEFRPIVYEEYEFQGKKYIRIKANTCYNGELVTLSNGKQYGDGDYVWVEVQPIRWLIDDQSKLLIAKKGLVSGIQYQGKNQPFSKDFETMAMYHFLNNIFINDIIPDVLLANLEQLLKELQEKDESFQTVGEVTKVIDGIKNQKILRFH